MIQYFGSWLIVQVDGVCLVLDFRLGSWLGVVVGLTDYIHIIIVLYSYQVYCDGKGNTKTS